MGKKKEIRVLWKESLGLNKRQGKRSARPWELEGVHMGLEKRNREEGFKG